MIRAAFIGTGGISRVHLDALRKRKDVRITALCDMDDTRLKERLAVYGGTPYNDFKEMLKKEKFDAVWLCTPSNVREAPLIACAEAGIPVFCEKPAEHSLSRGLKIADKLDKLNAKVQVGYVFRSTKVLSCIRERIMKEDNIHLVNSFYGCKVSLTMQLPAWFYKKEISGGALIDQATHNLDLLRCIFGEVAEVRGFAVNPVHKKKAGYTVDEVISLSLRFESGILASHIHTWIGDGWRNEIMLSGEKACYRLNPGGRLTIERKDADPVKSGRKKTSGPEVIEDKESMYSRENDTFIKMVKKGDWNANPSSYRDALRTLQLTIACDKAVTEGRTVKIKKF